MGRDPTTGLLLHDKQLAFVESPAKRKVIVAGRRAGKTTGVSVEAARGFRQRRRVLYAAPTQEQTDTFWEYCKEYFWEDIKSGTVYKNESRRILDWHGRIRAKTAWDEDSLRGDYADKLILEEWSLMDPSAWNEVGAPMLLDNDGDATFIFTPKRKNHAHKTYLQAKSDESGRWAYWHFTSHDNPYLSEYALNEITADMTQDAYRQEILAEFLENEGTVFRNIADHTNAPANEPVGKHKDHRIVAGVDWGKHNDFTVFCYGCATCQQELVLYRSNNLDYRFQRQRLEALDDRWNASRLEIELNAMGEPLFEELQASGLQVSGFQTTASSKQPLIEGLVLCFEQDGWQFLDNDVATAELEAFERQVNPNTNRARYSAPEGMHDDTVIARALMVHAAQQHIGDFVW